MAYLTFSILGINPSTESALEFCDLCSATDAGNSAVLILTAALELSYLPERNFAVIYPVFCSSPVWSAPKLHSWAFFFFLALYLLPLGTIIRKYGVSFHFYADNSQIYLKPLKINDSYCAQHLFDCLQDIEAWMALNFLNLSENNTEVTMLGPRGGSRCPTSVGYIKPIITNLIVKNHHNLSMDQQILKSSFSQLQILVKVKPFLFFFLTILRVLYMLMHTKKNLFVHPPIHFLSLHTLHSGLWWWVSNDRVHP